MRKRKQKYEGELEEIINIENEKKEEKIVGELIRKEEEEKEEIEEIERIWEEEDVNLGENERENE